MGSKSSSGKKLRKEIIRQCQWMNSSGLNQGTSGNISVRHGNKLLITPSGIPYDRLKPSMLASLAIDGTSEINWKGPFSPSSEWRFHLDIMRARPEVGAIVHTHSAHATALAMLRKPIPACHYMVAAFGGNDIRCAGYARYGTQALSALALKALVDRKGCLLANHGMITVAETLDKAMWLAVELEALARQYLLALNVGEPVLLTAEQIAETARGFASYGLIDPARRATAAKPASQPVRATQTKPAEPVTTAPNGAAAKSAVRTAKKQTRKPAGIPTTKAAAKSAPKAGAKTATRAAAGASRARQAPGPAATLPRQAAPAGKTTRKSRAAGKTGRRSLTGE